MWRRGEWWRDAIEGEGDPVIIPPRFVWVAASPLSSCVSLLHSRKSGHGSASSDISPIASKVGILSPEIATRHSLKVARTTKFNWRLSNHTNHPLLGYGHHI